MERNSKKEIVWVLAIFLIALGITYLYVEEDVFAKEVIEIQLYDTYFILEIWFLLLAVFLIFLLLTYLIKETFHKFRRIIPNFILAISILGSILAMTYFITFFCLSNTYIWTYTYSDLAEAQGPKDQSIFLLLKFLLMIQFFLLAGLFLLGIRIGVFSKRQKSSPSIGWRS